MKNDDCGGTIINYYLSARCKTQNVNEFKKGEKKSSQ